LDTESKEWKDAVMVRKAMNIAIDRQAIVDELLSGFGATQSVRDWMGHDDRANPDWVYDFDPDLARQMLADVGYPDGFGITLTPAIRGAPAEVEACEAVAQYWEDIGISVKLQNVPYATIRPELITRKYQGVTCHTVGVRLSPIIGASNYVVKSTFSYGSHHPFMEENVSAATVEVDPIKIQQAERDIYDWIFDNSFAASLYTHDGIWPIGARLDPDWQPTDYTEVRTAVAFEYAKHR
jgi:peptide/nickel transport system substrate-binding protein